MSKKILLTSLNSVGNFASDEVGLISIASALCEKGYEVLFLYCENDCIKNKEEVINFKPDVFGIGIYNITKRSSLELCKQIKEIFPNITICAGGYFPTYYSKELLNEAEYIDVIIRGEGEWAFLEFLKNMDTPNKIKGITYRVDSKIIINKKREIRDDLNLLPFPIIDSLYTESNPDIVYLYSSRGCIKNCAFCLSSNFYKKWRGCDADRVVDGISYIYHKFDKRIYGFTDNSFEDSLIKNDYSRIKKIAEALIRQKLKINYYVNIRASFYKNASDDLMKLLIKSGLTLVYVGLESGNSFDLQLYNKDCTISDNEISIEFFRKFGIGISIGFISFNPYSTFENLRTNLEFLDKYKYASQLYFVNRLILYRGVSLFKKVKNDGLLNSKSYDNHEYKFIDRRIELLSNFLVSYFSDIRKKYSLETFLAHLFEIYKGKLNYFKRELVKPKDGLLTEINKMILLLNETRDILNANNVQLFNKLLNLSEDKWDALEARRIADQYFNISFIMKRINNIYKNKQKLDILLKNEGFHENILF